MENSVVYQSHPDVKIGSTTFRNVPTIIQFEDTPLMQVGKFVKAGYTTKFHIFHSDGTDLAVVKGAQIYQTAAGKLAKIRVRYENYLTVCELEGRPLFELRRQSAAALSGWAELYAPEGVLIKTADADIPGFISANGNIALHSTKKGGTMLGDFVCENIPIALRYTAKGVSVGIGTAGLKLMIVRGKQTIDCTIETKPDGKMYATTTTGMWVKRKGVMRLQPRAPKKSKSRTKPKAAKTAKKLKATKKSKRQP
jgi:hypothetical protein